MKKNTLNKIKYTKKKKKNNKRFSKKNNKRFSKKNNKRFSKKYLKKKKTHKINGGGELWKSITGKCSCENPACEHAPGECNSDWYPGAGWKDSGIGLLCGKCPYWQKGNSSFNNVRRPKRGKPLALLY